MLRSLSERRGEEEDPEFLPFNHWEFITNSNPNSIGRIWIGWNSDKVSLTVLKMCSQLIHVCIEKDDKTLKFEASFIYGHNTGHERRELWTILNHISSSNQSSNYIALGDFNVTLCPDEVSEADYVWNNDIKEFKTIVDKCCLVDLRYSGEQFTWTNGRFGREDFTARKLDRALVNQAWLDSFSESFTHFPAPGISDHSPIIVHINKYQRRKGRAFKFYNYWTKVGNYADTVKNIWNHNIVGTAQFQISQKLRFLKQELKIFGKSSIGLERANADRAREEVKCSHSSLLGDPFNPILIEKHKSFLKNFHTAIWIEEEILKQKSRLQWLEVGDKNSRYFHMSIKARRNRKRIFILEKLDGKFTSTCDEAKEEAIRYFKSLLGTPPDHTYPGIDMLKSLVNKRVPEGLKVDLDRLPQDIEIKNVLFSMNSDKAPGPDGFNAHFFKDSWALIGPDFVSAVKEFFTSGELLKVFNNTLIALIPKVPNPSKMGDFRPISCCNTIYKCISKIIANRLQLVLPDMIDQAQSAFVKGRKIRDNVLLAQDLLRDYHKLSGKPRVAAKVDIMKAYDSVSWEFLTDILDVLDFPPNIKKWILACITSPKYSINFNGESVGYFDGARGLRQGDPMSPYLFVLVMDTFSQLLHHNIRNGSFKYHWKCDRLHISHLCFADDLLILFNGDAESASLIRQSLDQFFLLTGLQANNGKSCLFFSNVDNNMVDQILTTLNFVKGQLPIRYLGVPLITSKLKKQDCEELVHKICARITSWKSKFLSYAGRAQLIVSVLTGIQQYWSGMFVLPKSILKLVNQILSRFLWAGKTDNSHTAKIAWNIVCRPKKVGGLGIKDIFLTNTILNLKHIGNLLEPSNKSLWKLWVDRKSVV